MLLPEWNDCSVRGQIAELATLFSVLTVFLTAEGTEENSTEDDEGFFHELPFEN
jgi:hypothetical protein